MKLKIASVGKSSRLPCDDLGCLETVEYCSQMKQTVPSNRSASASHEFLHPRVAAVGPALVAAVLDGSCGQLLVCPASHDKSQRQQKLVDVPQMSNYRFPRFDRNELQLGSCQHHLGCCVASSLCPPVTPSLVQPNRNVPEGDMVAGSVTSSRRRTEPVTDRSCPDLNGLTARPSSDSG